MDNPEIILNNLKNMANEFFNEIDKIQASLKSKYDKNQINTLKNNLEEKILSIDPNYKKKKSYKKFTYYMKRLNYELDFEYPHNEFLTLLIKNVKLEYLETIQYYIHKSEKERRRRFYNFLFKNK